MASRPKVMAVQGAAVLIAAAFLILGVLGFIPGATTHLDQLQWAGHHSGAMLFGVLVSRYSVPAGTPMALMSSSSLRATRSPCVCRCAGGVSVRVCMLECEFMCACLVNVGERLRACT